MAFDSKELLERLQTLLGDEPAARWLVAFSGGLDSTVLLHALANASTMTPVVAIHVDHGLHEDSQQWQAHCRKFARQLSVEFRSEKIHVANSPGSGPEAAMRMSRYAVLEACAGAGDCVLTAHHQDDQAETLLLNLLRGSGPAGLAGIGSCQRFGAGRLVRPLLGVSRDELRAYADLHDLAWIDDPSNADERFDRNFLRKNILRRLRKRWPAAAAGFGRSAILMSEASDMLRDLADIDQQRCGAPDRIAIDALRGLSSARQRNVLRRAVQLCGLPPAPASRIYQIVDELMPARPDAQPLVTWRGAEARRFRGHIYLMPQRRREVVPPADLLRPDGEALALGLGLGSLSLQPGGAGIDPQLAGDGLQVRYRVGGEVMRIAAGGTARKVKSLLQEEGIVPWMRDRLPFLYAGARLVAVGDLLLAADSASDQGLAVCWQDRPVIR